MMKFPAVPIKEKPVEVDSTSHAKTEGIFVVLFYKFARGCARPL